MGQPRMEPHQVDQVIPSELADAVASSQPSEGALLLQKLVEEEQELSLLNRFKPYEDKVPLVLNAMDVCFIVAVFNELDDYYIMKALFGNFQAVDEAKRQRILEGIDHGKLALLLNRMSIGIDSPKKAAQILRQLPLSIAQQAAERMESASVARILQEAGAGHFVSPGPLHHVMVIA